MKKLPAAKERVGLLIHSIRVRLVFWFTAILGVILTVFSGFVFANQSRDLRNDALMRLESKLTSIQEALHFAIMSGSGQIILPRGVLVDTDVFVWMGLDGQVLASQGPIPAQSVVNYAIVGLTENTHHRDVSPYFLSWTQTDSSHTKYLFALTPLTGVAYQTGFIVMGTPLDPYGLLRRLVITLAAGSLLTLAVALLGGFWLADRAMRPVSTITNTARTLSETDLSHRLNLKGKDELAQLANTFDAMLARLQSAFERQRQFVADASHELRTPLTIVNLETSRALAARRSSQEYQRALTVIHNENDFMTRLVNDLLVLARMDAGQANIEMHPVDLSEIALEAVDRLVGLASRSGVRIEAGELPPACLLGDRQYLLQMISNLVENAIKYTNGDTKLVRIETGTSDGTAWVRVADTGPGIAPEHLPHLFERFYRVDKARSRNEAANDSDPKAPSGSGLGLSIVKWIAQAHGGEVSVESTPGAGTTFEARFKAI